MTQTKQNAPYGYYELGLRADMLEVELKAACAACTHLHEKLEAAEADWRASAERYDREVVQLRSELLLAAADRDAFDAERQRLVLEELVLEELEPLQAKLQAVETDRDEWILVSRDWRVRAESAEAQAAKWRDDAERVLQAKDAAEARAERAEAKLQAVETDRDEWIQVSREYQRDIERRAEMLLKPYEARYWAEEGYKARANAAEARANAAEARANAAEARAESAEARAESAEARAESAEADVRAVRDLLRKPGCWSEWARECLAVISGGGK
jgi:chromosome segregation ATPase